MVINKLILDDAHHMNEQEMKGTRGGVDLNHYCCVLYCLLGYNYKKWSAEQIDAAFYGIDEICTPGGFAGSSGCQMGTDSEGLDTCDYVSYN